MSKSLDDISIKDRQTLPQRVYTELRQLIEDGTLKPGDKLPSTQELARRWDASAPTIHKAMRQLVREGMLERQPRAGTFVRRNKHLLRHIVIYDTRNVWADAWNGFQQQIMTHLYEYWSKQGVHMATHIDPRPQSQWETPWPELLRMRDAGQLDGIIMTAGNRDMHWVKQLGVPCAVLSHGVEQGHIQIDFTSFASQVMADLKQRNIMTAGLICTQAKDKYPSHADLRTCLLEKASASGITIDPPSQIIAPADESLLPRDFERFGYEGYKQIIRQSNRPQALIVFSDIAARGVILAAMQNQPERRPSHFVFHRNKEIGLFCPIPATFVEVCIQELAEALSMQIQKQFAGKASPAQMIPFHIKPAGA
jgi:DNA-binding transcriptional regulator YhcF (GntR family)